MESVDSVRDILEVFGAIDRAVREADDPRVTAAADKLIPGLATANPEWYAELQSRFFGSSARKTPKLGEALQRIADYDADENTGRLTPAQKARLLYGIQRPNDSSRSHPPRYRRWTIPMRSSVTHSSDLSAQLRREK